MSVTIKTDGTTAALPKRPLYKALTRGWRGKCPACGEGRLFSAYLKVNDTCPACGEELFHHRADDAAGGGKHGAGDQGRDRHGPRQITRRHLQRIKQLVDDICPLDHIAHEQEQRDGDQRIVLHHRIGVLVQQIEYVVVEGVGDYLDATRLVIGVVAEADAHGEQREGYRKPQQHHHDEEGQH